MASEAQIQANRENARRSTGPATQAGKEAVAKNAITHGVLCRRLEALPEYNAEEYQALTEAFFDDLKPRGAVQEAMVQQMVSLYWRMRRAAVIEGELMYVTEKNLGQEPGEPLAMGYAFRRIEDTILKISQYEHRMSREFRRIHTDLRELQSGTIDADCRSAQGKSSRRVA